MIILSLSDCISYALIFAGIGFMGDWSFCLACGSAMVERIRKKLEKKELPGD